MIDEVIKSIRTTMLLIGAVSLFTLLAVGEKKDALNWIEEYEETFIKFLLFDRKDARIEIPNNSDESSYLTTSEDTASLGRLEVLAHVNHALPAWAINNLCEYEYSETEDASLKSARLFSFFNWQVSIAYEECSESDETTNMPRKPFGNHIEQYQIDTKDYESFGKDSFLEYETSIIGNKESDLLFFCDGYLVDELDDNGSCDEIPIKSLGVDDYEMHEMFSAKWRLYHQIRENNFASIQLLISNTKEVDFSLSFNNLSYFDEGGVDFDPVFATGDFRLQEHDGTVGFNKKYYLDDLITKIEKHHGKNYQVEKLDSADFHVRYQSQLRIDYRERTLTLPVVNQKIKAVYMEIGVYLLLLGLLLWLHQLFKLLNRQHDLTPAIPWMLYCVFYWGKNGFKRKEMVIDIIFESLIVCLHFVLVASPIFVVIEGATIKSKESFLQIGEGALPNYLQYGLFVFILVAIIKTGSGLALVLGRLWKDGKNSRVHYKN